MKVINNTCNLQYYEFVRNFLIGTMTKSTFSSSQDPQYRFITTKSQNKVVMLIAAVLEMRVSQ